MMKKGDKGVGIVSYVDFPNKGRVICGEDSVTVKGVLPGQKVAFAVSKKKAGRLEGRLLAVEERSPMETRKDICPHSDVCGGCAYQTLPYERQLELKKHQVKKLMDAAIAEPYDFEGILPSPSATRYRNKMEYSFGDEVKDGPLALGLHKKGSLYDVVPVYHCGLVHEDYNQILGAVADYFREKQAPFYHKMRHQGYLRHLLVRRGVMSGEITVHLVTTTERDEELIKTEDKELTAKLLELPLEGKLAGIMHLYYDGVADTVKADRTEILYGKDWFDESLLGLKFRISTFSFFQTNSRGAEVLYTKVREYVGETKDKVIFDLYSGTGTIAQILAPVAKKVIGVEIVEEAVEAARTGAVDNGLANCEFIAGDVLKVLDEIAEKPDFIVLDPPRDGVHPKALRKIIEYGVERMVYISCKPTSLARDLEILQEQGYQAERICAVDQFPMTVHVECVVLMTKVQK